jgi:N6-adenosine-specific RNA methylase IME4
MNELEIGKAGEPLRARVLLADPPWQFTNIRTGGSFKSGAEAQYATMGLQEIQDLPIPSILAPASVGFLWIPASLKFSHGGPVLAAWGFRYVGTVYWNKARLGMGFWFRSQVEELLFGVRGDVKPFRCQLPNLITAPAGKHSEKPAAFHRLIESATGEPFASRNLELFGRTKIPGWTVTGLELTGRDVRDDLRRLAAGRGV